jgi:hypothetical protein
MFKLCSAFLVVATVLVVGTPVTGQGKGRVSPHDTISAVIDKNRVTISYGRPNLKGRKIFGTAEEKALHPYGMPWRAGADEATILTTQYPLAVGDATIPAGAYTLYLVPEEKGPSKLAFSPKVGGWGIPVDTKNDLVRVDVKKDSLPTPMEQFTIAIEKGGKGGVLKMSWENTQFSVEFTKK